MYPPTVKLCPARQGAVIPSVVISIPWAWHDCVAQSVDVVLSEDVALMLADEIHRKLAKSVEVQTRLHEDGREYVVPAEARHAPRVRPVTLEEWEASQRYELIAPSVNGHPIDLDVPISVAGAPLVYIDNPEHPREVY